MIEVAKVSSKGQVTIPVAVRERLKVGSGDKIVFAEEGGRIVLENTSALALKSIRSAMAGEAEKAGIATEADVVALVDEVRAEIWEERYANND